jgi:isoprenylcysteine carboxyl methyltransferase (ICMT) family protein YpbQ
MKDKLIFFLWRRRTSVFAVGPLLMLLLARPSLRSWLLAIPLVVLGEMVRFWAAGHLEKNNRVVTSGPFGYVRNPLYVGSFLIFCGLCVMMNRWILAVAFLAVFVVFHIGATVFEERHLQRVFGDDFTEYRKRVPRLIPRLRSIGGQGKYSFALACENREPKSAVGTVVVVLLFGLRAVFANVDILRSIANAVR